MSSPKSGYDAEVDANIEEAKRSFDAFRNFQKRGGEDRLAKVVASRGGVLEASYVTRDAKNNDGTNKGRSGSYSPVRGHSTASHRKRGEARAHLATEMYPQRRDGQEEQTLMQRRRLAEPLESPILMTERVKRDGTVGNIGQRTQEDLLLDRTSNKDTVGPTMFDVDPSDPTSYTYGGEASYAMAFSHAKDTDATEDERQMRFREKHEQTFAALGNMKPFLKTLFSGDDEDELEWGQPNRVPHPSDDASLAPLGGGSMADGTDPRAAGGHQSRAMYGQSTRRHATRETPSTASSILPSFSYHDMVAREMMKPLILQTTTTTDRCPLTTKTCAPTFTVFNTDTYVRATGDTDAGLYFSETASRTAEARKHSARSLITGIMQGSMGGAHSGGHVHIPTSSYNTRSPYMFSADNIGQGNVADGMITTDKMSSGMRVFRDMMLPTTKIARDSASETRTAYYDEKELVKKAQLRMLLQTIQDAKPISERSHMPPRLW